MMVSWGVFLIARLYDLSAAPLATRFGYCFQNSSKRHFFFIFFNDGSKYLVL
tara:strand:- start:56 stop:211 length:156 start_codon:yes stop_codon:yes gene_type:complete